MDLTKFRDDLLVAADIPDEFRVELLRHVTAMEHALDLALLKGADGLVSAVDQVVGAAIRLYAAGEVNEPSRQRWMERLGEVAQKIVILTGLAESAYQIGENVRKMFELTGRH